jgi:hypothetical protein
MSPHATSISPPFRPGSNRRALISADHPIDDLARGGISEAMAQKNPPLSLVKTRGGICGPESEPDCPGNQDLPPTHPLPKSRYRPATHKV